MRDEGRWRWRSAAVEAAFLGALLGASPARAGGIEAAVVSPMVKVAPEQSVAGEGVARIEAARGEWEPFQIVVRGPLTGLRAEATALEGPGPALPLRLYRVAYLDVKTPSSVEGRAGRWPDALVPDVDAYVGERRRAFPVDVPAGETRVVWAEVFVPHDARPGAYAGAVTLTAAARPPRRVPVQLKVHRFALPRTPSLPATYGFSQPAMARAHHVSGAAERALAHRYGVAALRHRVALHGGSLEPPPFEVRAGRVAVRFDDYDAEVGPFLDGTADRGGPAEGMRWAAIDLRVPQRLAGAARDQYLRTMVAHLAARGWLDRVFDYTADEPKDEQLAEVRARAAWLKRVAPKVPRLVTRALTPALDGDVDIWCPVVNHLDDKPDNMRMPGRDAYGTRRVWWYHSCMSHGCDIVGGRYFTGWPSHAVDAPAASHRILEWLSWRYRIGGELYYNTVEAYARGLDPWTGQHLFGGNGDGTLFYPGDPRAIGGDTPVPVESIRLKLVREGLEDYEYLKLHEARFGRAATDRIAAPVAPRAHRFDTTGARLMAARRELARQLDALSAKR